MNDTRPETGPKAGAGPTTASGTSTTAADTELVYDDTPAPPGRPVRLEPTPPGFWRLVLGAVVALLGPFFGILIGSTVGTTDPVSRMDPLYWGFFIGGIIGAVAILVAASGGLALFRHARSMNRENKDS